LSPIGNEVQTDTGGAPLVGGHICTYLAGTTTPATTYTTSAAAVQQATEIELNAQGLPDNPIWIGAGVALKFIVKDALDVPIRTIDNVLGVNDPSAVATDQWITYTGTPTYLSATTFSVAGDLTGTFLAGRRLKTSNSGGTVYSTISSSSFAASVTTVTVVNDSSALDVGLSQVSYGIISPTNSSLPSAYAPAFRNKLRNAHMTVAQRGVTFAGLTTSAGTYAVDGWRYFAAGTSAVGTVTQNTDSPGSDILYSLRSEVTTADASIAAGDYVALDQPIEGYLVRDLIGNPIAISFWVRSAKTGTHGIYLRNSGSDRTYLSTYTIVAADTWEKKTILVPDGLITAGTWNWTTGTGVILGFVLTCGSTFQGAATDSWQTGNYVGASGQVNCLDTIGNVFAIAGPQMERGSAPTSLEVRDYASELANCQRYLPVFAASGAGWEDMAWGYFDSTSGASVGFSYIVEPRVAPTGITVSSVGHFNVQSASATSAATAITFFTSGKRMCRISVTGTGTPYTTNHPALLYSSSASARIIFTGCEL
jgi:hypothetical protein